MHQMIEQGTGKAIMGDSVETGRMCAVGTNTDGNETGEAEGDPEGTVQGGHREFQGLLRAR